MFFYLSFLRAPPSQSAFGSGISATPQIANDLRTELFEGQQDLYYQWVPVNRPSYQGELSEHELLQATPTRPVKFTTWRSSTAYKELTIPPPPVTHGGSLSSWVLIIRADHKHVGIPVISLDDPHLGKSPFPVMSLPIQFHPRAGKGQPGKQTRIQRIYQLRDTATISKMIIAEQTSFDLDKKIWDSGIGLSSWLLRLKRREVADAQLVLLKDVLFLPQSRNMIELGAGTGVLAITLAALRNEVILSEKQDVFFTTDLASAMPLLRENITRNAHLFPLNLPQANVLDWEDKVLPSYTDQFAEHIDAIIMADVTYNTDSFTALVTMVGKLIKLSKKPPIVLLGYKERHSAERELWDMIGIPLVKVDEIPGAGGAPIEVWLHVPA